MNFANIDPIALLVAVIGVGGAGAFLRDGIDGILKLRGGMSARETKRKLDIVQQRDEALEDAREQRERAENEANYRGQMTEYAQVLRVLLVGQGMPLADIPEWPIRAT